MRLAAIIITAMENAEPMQNAEAQDHHVTKKLVCKSTKLESPPCKQLRTNKIKARVKLQEHVSHRHKTSHKTVI